MSIMGLLCLLLALVAALLLVLYWLQRRDLKTVGQLAQQLQKIAVGGRLGGRVDISTDQPELAALATTVNHLITRVSAPERNASHASPKLFGELADRIHEAVLVHRDTILHANRQFATLVGVERVDLIGRRLGDLVPPEYSDLVSENIRRRLAGEPAAERYEIEMVGVQGLMSRLEITSTVLDYEGEPALLITGVEIVPTQTMPALRALPAQVAAASAVNPLHLFALDSLAEAIIATDTEGHITYLNAAAEHLTGAVATNVIGRPLQEIIGLVDETDRRLLSAPVTDRMAALSGVVRALEAAGIEAEDVVLRRPTLDEVFLHLTGDDNRVKEAV